MEWECAACDMGVYLRWSSTGVAYCWGAGTLGDGGFCTSGGAPSGAFKHAYGPNHDMFLNL